MAVTANPMSAADDYPQVYVWLVRPRLWVTRLLAEIMVSDTAPVQSMTGEPDGIVIRIALVKAILVHANRHGSPVKSLRDHRVNLDSVTLS